jgi:hypothetical protein
MTTPAIPLPSPDRPVFFAGQLLTAADLGAQHALEAQLRRLHHRTLHGWGIAAGLSATASRGDTAVVLEAGYAIDSAGRELVAGQAITAPVPPVAAGPSGGPVPYVLVLRWTEDADAVVQTRDGDCGAQGSVRRSDAPTVAWLDPPAVRAGLDVILADVQVQRCRLVAPPDPVRRRLLTPPPAPFAACGSTMAGETVWTLESTGSGQGWAVSAEVDTAEAGFGDVPVYLARLGGDRVWPAGQTPSGRAALIDGAPYVEQPEAGRFRVVVPLIPGTAVPATGAAVEVNPADVIAAAGFADRLTTDRAWYVEWIGVQS